MQCGPVRYRVDARRQAKKRPFDHKVIVRPTNFQLPPYLENEASYSIQEVYSVLAADDERNRLIVEDVMAAIRAKRFPVLMTERREHVDVLASLLAPHILNVFVMRGGMGKRQRQKLVEQIANVSSDEPRVIVATGRYLGEGFDNDELDTLFMALPISWRGTLTQYAGRLHRLNESKKEVIIYDYVDVNVPVLVKMHARRRAGYKAIGYAIALPDDKNQASQLPLQNL
jgi:superfamily II DNA or RNA helicase